MFRFVKGRDQAILHLLRIYVTRRQYSSVVVQLITEGEKVFPKKRMPIFKSKLALNLRDLKKKGHIPELYFKLFFTFKI